MYCANCAAPITPGLSYCNRCGASLKEKESGTNTGAISAFLTAITLLGIAGLGIMFGGSLALRKAAGLSQEMIAIFMLFTFFTTCLTEVLLIRQLSKLNASPEPKRFSLSGQPPPYELRAAPGEPVPSVTENTTRTLEYSHRERS